MKKAEFIPSLTPLRGIAAMLVFFFHIDIFMAPLLPKGNFAVDKLYLMVDLFFILSGFIMYHVYGDQFKNKVSGKDFWQYMKARFARLYPLHLVMLLFLVSVYLYLISKVPASELPPVFNAVLNPDAIPTSLLLIQAWGMHIEAPWNTASWSISVEWFLYLLFPFLIMFMVKYKKVARWILGSLVIGGALAIMYYLQPWTWELRNEVFQMPEDAIRPLNSIDVITGPALLRGFCGFVLGMITYELYQSKWLFNLLSKGFLFPVTWVLLFALWYRDSLPDIFTLGIFSLMILNVAYAEGLLKKILNNRVLNYLGDISYSIYMVHIPLILALFMIGAASGNAPDPTKGTVEEINYLANWGTAMIGAVIVLIVASLTYRFIEKPGRKYLRALGRTPKASELKEAQEILGS